MTSFFELLIYFLKFFENDPALATAYIALFLYSCFVIAWIWKKYFSKDHLLHEQAKLLHSNLKDSAVLAEEFLELKEKAHKAQKDIESLQNDNNDLIKSLEILNQRFFESETIRQILIEENHELRYLFHFIWHELLIVDQKNSVNKYIKFDYKKYLDDV